MAIFFTQLKPYVSFDKLRIDNYVFRLHTWVTPVFLVASSLLVMFGTLIEKPIQCTTGKEVPEEVMNTYCWIHSTFTLPDDFYNRSEAHPGVRNQPPEEEGQERFHKYYQWVYLTLLFQALLFWLPKYIWQAKEGEEIEMTLRTEWMSRPYPRQMEDLIKAMEYLLKDIDFWISRKQKLPNSKPDKQIADLNSIKKLIQSLKGLVNDTIPWMKKKPLFSEIWKDRTAHPGKHIIRDYRKHRSHLAAKLASWKREKKDTFDEISRNPIPYPLNLFGFCINKQREILSDISGKLNEFVQDLECIAGENHVHFVNSGIAWDQQEETEMEDYCMKWFKEENRLCESIEKEIAALESGKHWFAEISEKSPAGSDLLKRLLQDLAIIGERITAYEKAQQSCVGNPDKQETLHQEWNCIREELTFLIKEVNEFFAEISNKPEQYLPKLEQLVAEREDIEKELASLIIKKNQNTGDRLVELVKDEKKTIAKAFNLWKQEIQQLFAKVAIHFAKSGNAWNENIGEEIEDCILKWSSVQNSPDEIDEELKQTKMEIAALKCKDWFAEILDKTTIGLVKSLLKDLAILKKEITRYSKEQQLDAGNTIKETWMTLINKKKQLLAKILDQREQYLSKLAKLVEIRKDIAAHLSSFIKEKQETHGNLIEDKNRTIAEGAFDFWICEKQELFARFAAQFGKCGDPSDEETQKKTVDRVLKSNSDQNSVHQFVKGLINIEEEFDALVGEKHLLPEIFSEESLRSSLRNILEELVINEERISGWDRQKNQLIAEISEKRVPFLHKQEKLVDERKKIGIDSKNLLIKKDSFFSQISKKREHFLRKLKVLVEKKDMAMELAILIVDKYLKSNKSLRKVIFDKKQTFAERFDILELKEDQRHDNGEKNAFAIALNSLIVKKNQILDESLAKLKDEKNVVAKQMAPLTIKNNQMLDKSLIKLVNDKEKTTKEVFDFFIDEKQQLFAKFAAHFVKTGDAWEKNKPLGKSEKQQLLVEISDKRMPYPRKPMEHIISLDIGATKIAERFVEYSRNTNKYSVYFKWFLVCEVLTYVILAFNIWLMHFFLGNVFATFGLKFWAPAEMNQEDRDDVFSTIFPKAGKCTFKRIGPSGTIQTQDGLCVLPLNIINEKIYIFLWYWLSILAIVSLAWFLFRILTTCMSSVRGWELQNSLHNWCPRIEVELINKKLNKYRWFFLSQLGYNLNPKAFTLILKKVIERWDETARELGTLDGQFEKSEKEPLI